MYYITIIAGRNDFVSVTDTYKSVKKCFSNLQCSRIRMASSQQDLDKSFCDLKEMFPAMEAPDIWSAYLANEGNFDATLVSKSVQ